MNRWMLTPLTLALLLPWAVPPAAAQAGGGATVAVEQSDEYGAYLVDADGQALYLFTADKRGSGNTKAVSDCYDACADAWPPLLSKAQPQVRGKADASLLGTMQRRNGETQVTYDGWPLYYYVKDKGQDEPAGQDVHGFGGEWYLVTPAGEKVEEK